MTSGTPVYIELAVTVTPLEHFVIYLLLSSVKLVLKASLKLKRVLLPTF